MSNPYLIVESAIMQEPKIVKQTPTKALFKMVIQDMDTPNRNKRIYPTAVVKEALENCEDRIKNRAFFGELDHPLLSGDNNVDGMRQSSVMLKDVSHIIRDIEITGNLVHGLVETLNTPNGKILLGLVQDKVGIGLSMRGMGELDKMPSGYSRVIGPLSIVSYDAVYRPSHAAAVVDFNEMRYESSSIIHESSIQEGKNSICVGDQCYLPNYFDRLIESCVIQFFDKWV